MAYLFNDATPDYWQVNTAVLTAVPISMVAWYNINDLGVDHCLVCILWSAGDQDYFMLRVRSLASQEVEAQTRRDTQANANSTTGTTINTWHHAAGVWDASDSRAAFIDGGSKGTNGTDVSPATLNRTNIGTLNRNSGPINNVSGLVAEVAIWNIALTDEEVAVLAAGYSPLFVHPQNLILYSPMIRSIQDRIGAVGMTSSGSPTVADHPPIIYSAPPMFTGPLSPAESEEDPGLGAAEVAAFGSRIVRPPSQIVSL